MSTEGIEIHSKWLSALSAWPCLLLLVVSAAFTVGFSVTSSNPVVAAGALIAGGSLLLMILRLLWRSFGLSATIGRERIAIDNVMRSHDVALEDITRVTTEPLPFLSLMPARDTVIIYVRRAPGSRDRDIAVSVSATKRTRLQILDALSHRLDGIDVS